MNPAISVIVPVYKAENYMKNCISSVLNQTFADFELILVDDGSPDGSGAVCDEYAASDSRVSVIHKQNGGAGSARNVGLDAAVGEYIFFVDCDDHINVSVLSRVYELAVAYEADLVEFYYKPHRDINADFSRTSVEKTEPVELTARDLLVGLYTSAFYGSVYPVNKLYKRELFDGLRFEHLYIAEDTLIAPQIYARVKKAVAVKEVYYYCFFSSHGIKSFDEKKLVMLDVFERNRRFFADNGFDDIARLSDTSYAFSLLGIMKQIKKARGKDKNYRMVQKKYNGRLREFLSQDSFSKKQKLLLLLFRVFPSMYGRI